MITSPHLPLQWPKGSQLRHRVDRWVGGTLTHERPVDRFEGERAHLRRLNPAGYDLARICQVRATKQFRVPLDSNHYTVPSRYAGLPLTLKAHADRVCASMTATNS